VAVFQHDITDRKRDELALADHAKKVEAINTELDRFAYIVSHDLKAPLRAIQNLSSWIQEDLGDKLDEETQQNMQLLQQRVQKMNDMIDGILRYSRAGRFKGEPSTFYLNVVVKELVDQMSNDTQLKLELPTNDRLIRADKLALEQVFANLVSNAVRYGSVAGTSEIKITVDDGDEYLTIGVHDKGPGVPESYHEQIFEIFRTAGEIKHQDSHGIGLSIVKKIVSDQGGKIWLESELGKGAHFYFTWPKGG
jgi:signal transduction histidine kinase